MPEITVRIPGGRWLTRKEALDWLGIPESEFRRLLAAKLIAARGKGSGQRFDAVTVYAVGVLWGALEGLLPEARRGENEDPE